MNENYKSIIDKIISKYDENTNPVLLKNLIIESLKNKTYKQIKINAGVNLIEQFIKKINLLNNFKYGKHKGMEEIIKYSIANKISDPTSILNSYFKRDLSGLDLEYSKNSFYRMLNILLNNKKTILKNTDEIRTSYSTKSKTTFFDSTTIYFESFQREGLRMPGYSKDGKFKEDQIVMGMACHINGIPIFYEVFPGNTADIKTLIPFFNEFKQLFPEKRIIVVADRGMSSAENIKFLERNQIDFLISYRAKVASKKYK
ncbi:IS1634 family transposase [Mycoplasmopsis felis]|uniref:IS1634 family transposase n=1 Tax=Mycoplasmopsis felis TaxID=33923 RepID=UPI002AFEA541|nr:IS1634 family transposase [Mycoplasmopsis felis]WQQ08075.1 IS1634 family transposase [Mycoplasmopsis felis]